MNTTFKTIIERIKNRTNTKTQPLSLSNDNTIQISEDNPEFVNISHHASIKEKNEKYKLYSYDEYTSEDLKGVRSKKFYRCESSFFKSLINEISTNPDSTYITPYNSLISEGYIPQTFSVLKYNEASPFDVYNSRILNHFRVPTVYITQCTNEDNSTSMLSIDFVGKNEEFKTLYDVMNINCQSTSNLLGCLQKAYIDYKKNIGEIPHNSNSELHNLKKDLVRQKLVSRFILGETDSSSYNFGIIENTTDKQLRMAPLFDLQNCATIDKYSKLDLEDLDFIYNNYPDILKEVITEAKNLSQIDKSTGCNKYFQILSNTPDIKQPELEQKIASTYTCNSTMLIEYCKTINMQKEETETQM